MDLYICDIQSFKGVRWLFGCFLGVTKAFDVDCNASGALCDLYMDSIVDPSVAQVHVP